MTGGSSTYVDGFVDAFDGDDPGPTSDGDGSDGADSAVDSLSIRIGGVSATLDPAGAGNVHLSLSAGGEFTVDSGSSANSVPDPGGVANFSPIYGSLARSNTGNSTGNLQLQFSAPDGANCVINFTFEEFFAGGT